MPRAGELWLIDFPFSSGVGSKRRPALVLWVDGPDAVMAVVTSAGRRSDSDVPLRDWEEAGLLAPSTVRLRRVDTFETSLLIRRLGRLTEHDANELRGAWKRAVGPQF
jgi:mRNA interferase MazF